MKQKNSFFIIGWIAVITFAAIRIIMGISSEGIITQITPFILTFILFSFALFHGIKCYGTKDLLVFLCITFVVSWLYENLSIITGFPFGHYYYTAALGPKLWRVPVYIMFFISSLCLIKITRNNNLALKSSTKKL